MDSLNKPSKPTNVSEPSQASSFELTELPKQEVKDTPTTGAPISPTEDSHLKEVLPSAIVSTSGGDENLDLADLDDEAYYATFQSRIRKLLSWNDEDDTPIQGNPDESIDVSSLDDYLKSGEPSAQEDEMDDEMMMVVFNEVIKKKEEVKVVIEDPSSEVDQNELKFVALPIGLPAEDRAAKMTKFKVAETITKVVMILFVLLVLFTVGKLILSKLDLS